MLAIPISLQNLITFAVNFADNLMIGSLGDNAISGVYMGNQLQSVLQMFVGGIEGAILILAAQYWGKKDTSSIRKVVSIGVKFAVAVGIVMSAVSMAFPAPIIRIFTEDQGVIAEGADYLRIVGATYLCLHAQCRDGEDRHVHIYYDAGGQCFSQLRANFR